MGNFKKLLKIFMVTALLYPSYSIADKSDSLSTDGIEYRRLGTKDKDKQEQIRNARKKEKESQKTELVVPSSSRFISTDGIDYRRLGTKDKEKQEEIRKTKKVEVIRNDEPQEQAPLGKHGRHRH